MSTIPARPVFVKSISVNATRVSSADRHRTAVRSGNTTLHRQTQSRCSPARSHRRQAVGQRGRVEATKIRPRRPRPQDYRRTGTQKGGTGRRWKQTGFHRWSQYHCGGRSFNIWQSEKVDGCRTSYLLSISVFSSTVIPSIESIIQRQVSWCVSIYLPLFLHVFFVKTC